MTYRIDPSFRRVMLLCGVFFGAVAVLLVVVPLFEPRADEPIGLYLAAIAVAALAWWGVRFYRRADRFLVETSGYGIRVGAGEPVPWSSIVAARERRVGQRLELLDVTGTKLAAVEYQLQDVDELIREIRRRSRISESSPAGTVFGERRPASDLVPNILFIAALSSAGVWLWIEEGAWIGLALPPLLLWSLYTELRDQVRQVELRERELVLRSVLRETLIPRDAIAEAEVALTTSGMQHQLACQLIVRDGSVHSLKPRGVDPFQLTVAVRQWLPRGVPVQVSGVPDGVNIVVS